MTTPPLPQPAPNPPSPDGEPLLTQRALLIFVSAAVIGAIVGVLTFFSGVGNAAGALLAGLTGFGASIFGLHRLTGD
ncbi:MULTISPECIES: hypothetical protein [Streptomyces]|uniref:Uncharacterized protein n=2 Tax=Streptomyces TaxID=1883 RepID=A0ABV9J8Z7_9ACTN